MASGRRTHQKQEGGAELQTLWKTHVMRNRNAQYKFNPRAQLSLPFFVSE